MKSLELLTPGHLVLGEAVKSEAPGELHEALHALIGPGRLAVQLSMYVRNVGRVSYHRQLLNDSCDKAPNQCTLTHSKWVKGFVY